MLLLVFLFVTFLQVTELDEKASVIEAQTIQETGDQVADQVLSTAQPPKRVPIELVRHSDIVAVLSAQNGQERILYYWDKKIALAPGDEIRQGSGGISELSISRNRARFHGPCRVFPRGLQDGVESIECRELLSAIFEISEPLRVSFPGGHAFECSKAVVSVERRDFGKELVIRNGGPGTLTLSGVVRDSGATLLPMGHRIVIPVLPFEDRNPRGMRKADWLSGLRVITGDGLQVSRSSIGLVLNANEGVTAVADIGGARILVPMGARFHLTRTRAIVSNRTAAMN